MSMETSETIEPGTMKYVFDMFGKSVSQMLQDGLGQRMAVDELRSQIRAMQSQISNIHDTLEEFEDRMTIKLSELRPTIYTRDGLPLDDALEMMQLKITNVCETSSTHVNMLTRMQEEIAGKVDSDAFSNAFRSATDASESYQDTSLTVQTLQKDLVKQRADMDDMVDKCMHMVRLQIEQFRLQTDLTDEDGDEGKKEKEYVTKKKFLEVIESLKRGRNDFDLDDSDLFDDGDLDGSLEKLKMANSKLDYEYRERKDRIGEKMTRIIGMMDDGDDEEEDWEYDDDFECDEPFEAENITEEREYRDIACGDEDVVVGDVSKRIPVAAAKTRRTVGLSADGESAATPGKRRRGKSGKKQKLLKEVADQREGISGRGHGYGKVAPVDEHKLASKVSGIVMTRVEGLLVDMLSGGGGVGGMKLEKGDAKALVQQLSTVQQFKQDISKLRTLVDLKMNQVECTQELSIRITREDFFSMLLSLFPGNKALAKAMAGLKKKLPPLKQTSERSIKDPEDGRAVIHKRAIQTANPASLAPARNSRLLALNQKYLKGADGKYYMRDVGGDTGIVTPSPVAGGGKVGVTPEQAFDFQPFLPVDAIREAERISVPGEHRARTPRDATD